MNVSLTRNAASTLFSSLAEGSTYAAAEDNGKGQVYLKLAVKDYNLPSLLGKNTRGNPVGAAVRLNDARVVFHFLDKKVVKANPVATTTFRA